MLLRLSDLRERISGSLWFVPALIVLALAVLAATLVELSGVLAAETLQRFPRVFGADAASSRSMLATIAGSMITVAGVTFSVTVVALAQASNQYTPRILRTFMRDRPSQTALGMLVGVFVYCLVVIRTIRSDLSVPSIAVLAAFVLAVLAIGLLIYFIHRIAGSLDAGSMVARVSAETVAAAERLFPERLEKPSDTAPLPPSTDEAVWYPLTAQRTGYIQNADIDSLSKIATHADTIVRMENGVGDFVVRGCRLACLANRQPDERLTRRLNECFSIDSSRTIHQDVDYGLRIIVDVALRALSPGVHDPTTATVCIDYIGAVLTQLADRRFEEPLRFDGSRLRVIASALSFEQALHTAVDEIRSTASADSRILLRLLSMLETVGQAALPSRREALLEQAGRIRRSALACVRDAEERADVERACDRLLAELAA